MSNIVTIETAALGRHADRIRKLMSGMVANSLAVGKELKEVRDKEFAEINPKGHRAGWKTWLRDEFKLSTSWANQLIQTYEKFGHLAVGDSALPSQTVLTFLAREHIPEDARREVLDQVSKGRKIGKGAAKKIVAKHRPSPKKANEIAKETGKPVEASDGYVYFGADADKVKANEERRTIVFSVREAIAVLARIEIQAPEFLEYAMPHQLWRPREEQQIKDALTWLKELDRAWDRRKS